MSLKSRRPRFLSGGRGSKYTLPRALMESALKIAYAGGWPARLWARVPSSRAVRVVRHELELFGGLAQPLRLAFLSDLHLGPTTASETLDAAFELVKNAEVDVLVLGGDYVFLDFHAAHAEELCRRVGEVRAAIKVAVLGNHDLWTDTVAIERALTRGGVHVLVNDALRLPDPWGEIAILGIDDPWTGKPDAERAVRACGDAPFKVAVSHSPDGLQFLAQSGAALLLAGHTHGGQIALPGERPIILPPGPYSKRFFSGLYRVGNVTLFVSRGVGATELPIRTYAPPEVAFFDLR